MSQKPVLDYGGGGKTKKAFFNREALMICGVLVGIFLLCWGLCAVGVIEI